MRARLTVLGFNLTILTFQINQVVHPGVIDRANIAFEIHRFSLSIALLLGAISTMLALVVFLASARLNREGTSQIHLLLTGDMLMYLSLVLTVFIFVAPYKDTFDQLIGQMDHEKLTVIRTAVDGAALFVWLIVAFAALAIQITRAPIPVGQKVLYCFTYYAGLISLTFIVLLAGHIEDGTEGPSWLETLIFTFTGPV